MEKCTLDEDFQALQPSQNHWTPNQQREDASVFQCSPKIYTEDTQKSLRSKKDSMATGNSV